MKKVVALLTTILLASGCTTFNNKSNVPKSAFPNSPKHDVFYASYNISVPKDILSKEIERKIKEALEKENSVEPRIIGSVIGGVVSGSISGAAKIISSKNEIEIKKNTISINFEIYASGIYTEDKLKEVLKTVKEIINKEIKL